MFVETGHDSQGDAGFVERHGLAGRVRISARTDTREEIAELSLERSAVDMIRVPIDRVVDETPQVRTEGDTTIVPIFEERLIVVKVTVLVEELHIRHRVERETRKVPVSLRRRHADVEHLDADGPSAA